jgi:hypothetical protein
MTPVRRALAGLAVPLLAAAGAVLTAPSAHAADVPIGCSDAYRILAKTGWFTTDDDGTVRADATDDPADVAQQFRICMPPDWQSGRTVLRSEGTERYLAPSVLTGQVRALSSNPTAANEVTVVALVGGSYVIESEYTDAFYDAREDLKGTPVYATAGLKDAEVVELVPVK